MHDNRSKTSRYTDRKIYRQTAQKTKKINVKPVVSRGGIRL